MNPSSPARVAALLMASTLSLHCGDRTALDDALAGDAGSLADAPDASSCVPAPPAVLSIGDPPESVISIALAASEGTFYAGTASIGPSGPLYVGAVELVPTSGVQRLWLPAINYNFGNVATDGALVYYPQTDGQTEGPNSAIYTAVGLAAIDAATADVQTIGTTAPPWSTSSNLNSHMIAATPAWPGVMWIGATSGASHADTLSSWNAQTGVVTVLAKGQSLSGLAVDASGVYWADVGGSQGITVYSCALGGGAPTTLASVPGGTNGVLLGVSANDVVFVSDYLTGAIQTVSKTGGVVRPLVTASAAWVNAFAWVIDPYLYWTESSAPTTLQRIPVAGGTAEVVPTQGQLQSLAFDACNVYIGSLGPAQVVIGPR